MSESEARKASLELPRFDALEAAIGRAMRQLEVWRERATASERERRRLQDIVDGMGRVSSELDPAELYAELNKLRAENDRLRQQLSEGSRQAEQLAREVEFLEDTR